MSISMPSGSVNPPAGDRAARQVVESRPGISRHLASIVLLSPAVIFLVAFFAIPAILLLLGSFHGVDRYLNATPGWSLTQYRAVLTTPYLYSTLANTTAMAAEVTALCLVLGYPVAYSLVHTRRPLVRAFLYAVVVSPLLTSVVVRTYGWIVILQGNGLLSQLVQDAHLSSNGINLLYTYPATVIAMTHVLLPFAILPLAAAIADVDPNTIRAARALGASRLQALRDVTLPLTGQGIASGGLLTFMVAMGTYITPLLVGGASQPIAATRIYVEAMTLFNLPLASAVSMLLLAITLVVAAAWVYAARVWERHTYG